MTNSLRYQVLTPSGTLTATVHELELALMVASFAGDGARVVATDEPELVVWVEGRDGEGACWERLEANLDLARGRSPFGEAA